MEQILFQPLLVQHFLPFWSSVSSGQLQSRTLPLFFSHCSSPQPFSLVRSLPLPSLFPWLSPSLSLRLGCCLAFRLGFCLCLGFRARFALWLWGLGDLHFQAARFTRRAAVQLHSFHHRLIFLAWLSATFMLKLSWLNQKTC